MNYNNSFSKKYIPGALPLITLTETEKQIVDLLNSYTEFYNKEQTDPVNRITLRITGGWVRDKLLGNPSHDIDIGIDNCSGESFVFGLKDWIDESSVSENIVIDDNNEKKISKIHKIKKNPDKSKHLETCTTKLFGLDIDFVNLRSESYTDDSRIPSITTGTSVEDAYRRDATLNALFFNLSSMEIEDLTGKGLKDLADGILRTPLEPRRTFLDDPLRCLRLIRFASNYGFKIEKNVLDTMKGEDIKIALDTKISRERIGVEIKKMIINKRGVIGVLNAFELIKEVNFSCIFDLGDTDVPKDWFKDNEKHLNYDILRSIDNILKYLIPLIDLKIINFDEILKDDNDKIIFYSSLILNHWRDEKVKVGKKENYVSLFCVLNGIKMPLKVADNVSLILKNIENIRINMNKFNEFDRSEIAENFILPYGDKWELNLLVNYCLEYFEVDNNDNDKINSISIKYEKLFQSIIDLKLEYIFKQQVLLNGKDLMKIVNKKPGPWLKPITEKLFKWQLNNPTCTKENMIEYLHKII